MEARLAFVDEHLVPGVTAAQITRPQQTQTPA